MNVASLVFVLVENQLDGNANFSIGEKRFLLINVLPIDHRARKKHKFGYANA